MRFGRLRGGVVALGLFEAQHHSALNMIVTSTVRVVAVPIGIYLKLIAELGCSVA